MNKKKVLVTFDSMRHPNTGFFFFGKSLSNCLDKQSKGLFDLTFYSHSSIPRELFPPGIKIINKSLLHKVMFPHKFDLIHFTDQYCHPSPSLLKGKKIITIHDINPFYERKDNPSKLDRYVKRMRGYINQSNHIVAISEFVASEIKKHFPESGGKLTVIHNGADELHVKENFKPTVVTERPYLFTIGMVCEKKNFHVLPCLLQGNNLELVIAGIVKGNYQQKILAEAKKYNCENRVKILGTISDDDKAWYYKNCHAFVFPSLAEGFGLPVIEAMHFGKPVFLSSLTSLPEIGGDKAFYFKNFDAEHMRTVFNSGLEYYNRSKEFRESIKERARLFHWERTAREYLNLYERALND